MPFNNSNYRIKINFSVICSLGNLKRKLHINIFINDLIIFSFKNLNRITGNLPELNDIKPLIQLYV